MRRSLLETLCGMALIAAALAGFAQQANAQPYTEDQWNVGNPSASYSYKAFALGQEFTPTWDAVGVVELHLTTNSSDDVMGLSSAVQVHIRTPLGAVLGTSQLLTLPAGFSGMARFELVPPVEVTPGITYIIALEYVSGANGAWGCNAGYQEGRRAILNGVAYDGITFLFSEGFPPVPGHDLVLESTFFMDAEYGLLDCSLALPPDLCGIRGDGNGYELRLSEVTYTFSNRLPRGGLSTLLRSNHWSFEFIGRDAAYLNHHFQFTRGAAYGDAILSVTTTALGLRIHIRLWETDVPHLDYGETMEVSVALPHGILDLDPHGYPVVAPFTFVDPQQEVPAIVTRLLDNLDPLDCPPGTTGYLTYQLSNEGLYGSELWPDAFTVRYPTRALETAPQQLYLGQIAVGETTTGIVTVMSTGEAPVQVTEVFLTSDSHPDFWISERPPSPIPLEPESSFDVEVSFGPLSGGLRLATLALTSNSSAGSTAVVPLSADGVAAPITPTTQIQHILDFLTTGGQTAALSGAGSGSSPEHRFNALRNMIKAAGDLLDLGDVAAACEQLQDAYQRCDGVSPPPDFVTGDARAELASLIQSLLTSEVCR
jgi:hypothetical protein